MIINIAGWKRIRNDKDYISYTSHVDILNPSRGTVSDYRVLIIHGFKPEKYGWTVNVVTSSNYPLENHTFTCKADAEKFAIKYMKENRS